MKSKLNKAPIGTGAYMMLKPLKVNSDIILVANKRYFEHKPNIDKQIYHYIPDISTNFMMLKAKKLDIGSLSPIQLAKKIDDKFKKNFNIYEKESNGYTYLGFNLKYRQVSE